MITQPMIAYYRCPETWLDDQAIGTGPESKGALRFAQHVPCDGHVTPCTSVVAQGHPEGALEPSCSPASSKLLPFDPVQVIDTLRYERYVQQVPNGRWSEEAWVKKAYYLLRPFLPIALRKHLQKLYLRGWETLAFPTWPVDCSVDKLLEKWLILAMQALSIDRLPFIWFWPEGHTACAMMTHDVETVVGRDFTEHVMDIDDAFGIKASFQIVPEKRYAVPAAYLQSIRQRGYEICVQGLDHDGNLFQNWERFLRQAAQINHYAQHFGARGFRSPILYRNIDWFQELCFAYDMSVPNVARLDPQRGGCCTVMPYFLPGGMLELPVTTIQDYSLFHILGDYSAALWQQQIQIIMQSHGLMSFIIHPDYIVHRRAQKVYKALLEHLVRLRSQPGVWVTLPGEVERWWRARSQMQLVVSHTGWKIVGPDRERARLAYAVLDGDTLVYELDAAQSRQV